MRWDFLGNFSARLHMVFTHRVVSRGAAFLAFILLFSSTVFAQTSASLSGTVTNHAGAPVSDAAVTIKNLGTSETRTVKTDAGGHYQLAGLPPGNFAVRAVAKGLGDETRGGISLTVNQAATLDIVMQSKSPDVCASGLEFVTTDCTLTWHGITVYGAYDVGVGWVSHGLPVNGNNYEGAALVNRNGSSSRFLIAPNNLQQTGLGVRGKEEFAPGWAVVFNASTGINPQSGLLADAPKTNTVNNGLPRGSYSEAIDGARAGQPFNDEYYGGISSERFGTVTFGRQRSLGTDAMLQYDPAGGSYGFSYIGYNGTLSGGGDTDDSRWDDAIKYRLSYRHFHFGAMYKFASGSGGCFSAEPDWTAAGPAACTPERAHNNAYGFDIGGEHGHFSMDIVGQHYNQAISVLNPLLGPQSPTQPYQSTTNSINQNPINGGAGLGPNLIDPNNTLYGIVTDNDSIMGAAKYTWNPFKFFVGYEFIWLNNPHEPLGVGATDQGEYILSGVEDDNLDSERKLQIWWAGGKYTYREKTDITLSFYQQRQNTFRVPSTCGGSAGFRSSCSGTLDELSLYADHHFTKRFDGYVGVAYSVVTGGLAVAIPHGPGVPYLHPTNVAPVIGVRFAF